MYLRAAANMIVVIADDHKLVRESIADVVARLNYGDLPVEILHASNYSELKALRGEARNDRPPLGGPRGMLIEYRFVDQW